MLTYKVTQEMPQGARNALSSTPNAGYESVLSLYSEELRKVLWESQRGRCAYCEISIPKDEGTLEHFHPQHGEFIDGSCKTQSGAKNKAAASVCWSNLLLVCAGGNPPELTCDKSKSGTDICGTPIRNPRSATLQIPTQVRIARDGTATPISQDERSLKVINSVLNLNENNLKNSRKMLMASTVREIGRRKRQSIIDGSHFDVANNKRNLEKKASELQFGSVYYSILENRNR